MTSTYSWVTGQIRPLHSSARHFSQGSSLSVNRVLSDLVFAYCVLGLPRALITENEQCIYLQYLNNNNNNNNNKKNSNVFLKTKVSVTTEKWLDSFKPPMTPQYWTHSCTRSQCIRAKRTTAYVCLNLCESEPVRKKKRNDLDIPERLNALRTTVFKTQYLNNTNITFVYK